MSPTQLELFNAPKARSTDPETSKAAAESVEAWVQDDALLCKFAKHGPLNDDELAAVCPSWYPPTLKSSRSRLSKRGLLVPTGEKRPSNRGKPMQVWRLAP